MHDFESAGRSATSRGSDLGPILTQYDEIANGGGTPQEIAIGQIGFARKQIATNALPFFKELREHRPIMQAGPVWLVARFADVEEILHRETIFSVQSYLPRMMDVIGPFVLSQDITPAYDHDISAMRLVVRREDLDRVREITANHANAIVADAVDKGKPFDIVQNLTRIVPLRLADEYYGFPGPDDETMKGWARPCFHEFFVNLDNNPDVRAAAVAAGSEMRSWIEALIEKRKSAASRADDVLGRLLALQRSGSDLGFDDEVIIRTLMGLVVGMVETTSQAAVQALLVMAKFGEPLEQAKTAAQGDDDPALLALILEALRFRPVNPLVVRVTTQDYRLGAGTDHATVIPKGSMVFALTWSAMHDQRVLDLPEAFQSGRPDYKYLHFATGHHACFGRYISRIQIPQILKALLVRNVRIAGEPVYAGPFPDEVKVVLG